MDGYDDDSDGSDPGNSQGAAGDVHTQAADSDSSSSSDTGGSSSDGGAEVIVNNASRHTAENSCSGPRPARKRARTSGPTTSKKFFKKDVYAIFLDGEDGPEVSLGIKLACKRAGCFKMQYLEENVENGAAVGYYTLTQSDTGVLPLINREHVFPSVQFEEITTITPQGRRKKTEKKVVSTELFDASVMSGLLQKAIAWCESRDDEHSSD